MTDAEGRLPGGLMSGARRVGGTVRRPVGDHTPFVHRLLRHLEAVGFPGAPRVLGVEDGEEVLTYVEGHVPVEVAPEEVEPVVFSPAGIASAFALIRRYHDATAGSGLAGGAEVVCHGDLSPWNTVYAGARGAVGLIDWDGARPGSRSDDAGYAVCGISCWDTRGRRRSWRSAGCWQRVAGVRGVLAGRAAPCRRPGPRRRSGGSSSRPGRRATPATCG